jgi:hypothetical protein
VKEMRVVLSDGHVSHTHLDNHTPPALHCTCWCRSGHWQQRHWLLLQLRNMRCSCSHGTTLASVLAAHSNVHVQQQLLGAAPPSGAAGREGATVVTIPVWPHGKHPGAQGASVAPSHGPHSMTSPPNWLAHLQMTHGSPQVLVHGAIMSRQQPCHAPATPSSCPSPNKGVSEAHSACHAAAPGFHNPSQQPPSRA